MKDLLTQAVALQELGAPGLKTSGGLIDEEFLKDLKGSKRAKAYDEMRHNDPVIGAALFGINQLIAQVSWTIVAADDSPRAIEWRDFVESAMFQDMSSTWSDTIEEILTMLPFGWAYLEVVYKLRKGPEQQDPRYRSRFNDGRVGWRKWALRGQTTLLEWQLDDAGGIKGMVQNPPPTYVRRVVPIEKALLFRVRTERNNPEGRSILRNAYRPWYFKKHIEEIEGIGVERDLAGYPTFKLDKDAPDIWNANDQDAVVLKRVLQDMISGVRRDEQEGMVLPWWVEFSLVSTGSRRAFDTSAIISRYDQRMLMSMMADFMLLGSSDTGSYALSVDKSDLFAAAIDGFMDKIADTVNRHAIPKLMQLNAAPVELTPSLTHGKTKPTDVARLADYLSKMVLAGVVTPTPELEAEILDVGGLPAPAVQGLQKRGTRAAFAAALARYRQRCRTTP